MKVKLINIILYCHTHMCEMCKYLDSETNKCNAIVNGKYPWHYKRLLDEIAKAPKIAKDIINDEEVKIGENNNKRTD